MYPGVRESVLSGMLDASSLILASSRTVGSVLDRGMGMGIGSDMVELNIDGCAQDSVRQRGREGREMGQQADEDGCRRNREPGVFRFRAGSVSRYTPERQSPRGGTGNARCQLFARAR